MDSGEVDINNQVETVDETSRVVQAPPVAASAEFMGSNVDEEGDNRRHREKSKKRPKSHQEVETPPNLSRSATPDSSAVAVSRKVPKSLPRPMPAVRAALPLLVCSVGNPGSAYANTLHSAGHTVLKRLAEQLQHPIFSKDRDFGNGLVSPPPAYPGENGGGDWTLWQSTSYMNDSGKGVRGAYNTWSRRQSVRDEGDAVGKLVIVHDELEKPLGSVTLKTGQGLSAKGHNGLKSIMGVMGKVAFARIGIGIGRPMSRDSEDVAGYVLRKMTPAEKGKIEGCVEQVVDKLRQLERG